MKPHADCFYFDSYEIRTDDNEIVFHYRADETYHFSPKFLLDLSGIDDTKQIESAVFALGMAYLPSFYKAFATKEIHVQAGALDATQLAFWQKLYTNGLGEFFLNNNLDPHELAQVISISDHEILSSSKIVGDKYLVAIGGGKDSIVAALKLEAQDITHDWFTLEPHKSINQVVEVSGKNLMSVQMPRENFEPIIELNKQGAYNGHVPISAVYGMSAVLYGLINGYGTLVFANEKSANVANTTFKGMDINHQYSKSFQWEQAMHQYIQTYIHPEINYFSILRNMNEVQILKYFTDNAEKYFNSFISCNPGLEKAEWCGQCPKCLFVFLGLSAFLSPQKVQAIFGSNLLEKKGLRDLFDELLGYRNFKPLDCIGTIEENRLLAFLALQKYQEEGLEIPALLQGERIVEGEQYKYLLEEQTDKHLIPQKFL